MKVVLLCLALTGCMDVYQVRPKDTTVITRVFGTEEQTRAFCTYLREPKAACAIWVGDRGVIFLPYNYTSHMAGHEAEHIFSGSFHK